MERKALLKTLRALLPVTGQNVMWEEESNFRFSDKEIRVADGSAMAKAELAEPSGLDCLVPAKLFVDLLAGMTSDEVEIKMQEDGDLLKVKGGRRRATYPVIREGQRLDNLDFEVDTWKPVPIGMLNAIMAVRFAASNEVSRGPLYAVKVASDHCVASDALRIAAGYWKETKECSIGQDVLISTDIVDVLAKHVGEVTEWAVKDKVIYFKLSTGITLGASLMIGNYPPAEALLEKATALDSEMQFPAGIIDVLAAHSVQQADVEEEDKEVLIAAKGKSLTVTTKAGREVVDDIELADEAALALSFRIHPGLLSSILTRDAKMLYGEEAYVSFGSADIPEGKTFSTVYLAGVARV